MVHGRILRRSAVAALLLSAGMAQAALPQEAVPGEYVVKVKDVSAFQKNVSLFSIKVESFHTVSKKNGLILIKRNMLENPEFSMSEIQRLPGVEIVDPNYIYRINKTPNDPKLEELWGLKNTAQKGGVVGMDIDAEKAWDIETGNKNVLVAVIDTGVDYTHPDLADNIWTNEAEANGKPGVDDDKNGYVDDIHGYDFVNKDGDPMDDHGHGTHVSGTIGAKGDDGQGIVGVNWNVRIMGVKFLSAGGSGTLEDAILAIDYATSMGAQIESNSWGGGGFTETLKQAIERTKDKNIVFVAAAGNDSNNNDEFPAYPASYEVPNIISVAALAPDGSLAYFSNYGRTTVHVAAPGQNITSSVPKKTNPSGYETWSGTSMATPHVSGIAALLLSHEPGLKYDEVKARIIKTSKSRGVLRSKAASGGIASAYYALSNQPAPVDETDPFNWRAQAYSLSSEHPYADKMEVTFEVHVPGASQFALFFERFETERGYDTIEFVDADGNVIEKWSGKHDQEFSPVFQGDSIKIHMKSDDSVAGYGFDISKVAVK